MKFTSSYYLVLTLLILVTCVKAKLWETIFKLDARTAVAENRLLTTITEIGKEWKITFEFRATSFLQNKVTNFLWLRSSQGFTLVNVGISKTKEIGFCYHLQSSAETEKCENLPRSGATEVKSYTWMSFEISQVQESGKSQFKVFVAGAEQYSGERTPPEQLRSVQIYASPEDKAGNLGTELWKYVTTQPGEIRRLSMAVPAKGDSSGSEDPPGGNVDSPTNVDSSGEWKWTGPWSACSATCSGGVSIKPLTLTFLQSICRTRQDRESANKLKVLGKAAFVEGIKFSQGTASCLFKFQ